ncbi:MAG: FAD:protein FMN transferase [Sphaerochaetaceae bacterium]|nr:FAD:protein FMN transferase [Sphaerochaetaceae bacterium]
MKHNIKSIKIIFIVVLFLTFFVSCSKKSEEISSQVESQSKLLLGTSCKITIYDNPSEKVFEQSFSRIEDIENKMSINIADSEVSMINKNAGIKPVVVSSDTFTVIKEALEVAALSNGAFDPTVGPLVAAWKIGDDDARVPPQEEIDSLLPLIDYKMVVLNEEERSVYLEKEGMMLDLGGIAKGYAADEVKKILAENNVKKAIINLGGNVLTVGTRVDNTKWRIGVQNPEADRGGYVMIVNLEDQALVTSGPYERFLVVDGIVYHHILDTNNGYPVVTDLTSASIIADNSFIADALSTALYSLGLEKGLDLINSIDDVEALVMDKNHNIYMSEGFDNINYTLSDETYKISNNLFNFKVIEQ